MPRLPVGNHSSSTSSCCCQAMPRHAGTASHMHDLQYCLSAARRVALYVYISYWLCSALM